MMFADVANEWADKHFKVLTYNTVKSYKAPLNRCIERFYDYDINTIVPIMINDYVYYLVAKEFSSKTVRNDFLVLNMIFNYALLCGYVVSNPCVPVKIPHNLPRTKRRIPTPSEIEKVKQSFNCEFGLCAYIILYTGLRKGELIALQYKDVDYDNKIISVTKSSYYKGNTAIIKRPKTEAGTREIPLLDVLYSEFPHGNPEHYVLTNSSEPITCKKFIVMWNKYLLDSKLYITPHQLRHAFATILFEADIDIKDAQDLLGHASIGVTRDIYTHISKKRKAETFRKLNQFIQ